MENNFRTGSGKVVGVAQGDTFVQHVKPGHIYRKLNAKGLDYAIYLQARMQCRFWKLVFPDGMELVIPFAKVDKVKLMRQAEAGKQIFVRLDDFNKERPVVQGSLMGKVGQ